MGMELEAEDYIDKPIDPKLLVARLAKLLKK
jgi:DNA-binding response OmpR family regulator